MATRRSRRLQDPQSQDTDVDEQDAPAATVTVGSKPKSSKSASKNAAIEKRAPKKVTKTGKAVVIGKAGPSALQVEDKLSSLSPELFGMIAENIIDAPTMNALARASKGLYSLMMPRLYGRIAVAAMFHAHIAKLIRTLEPHLTVKQKKQLKKEGKYKGQQEAYPTGLNEKLMPICAGYVKQLVVGVADPGRKHKYIVERYVEEALNNFVNLEILEIYLLTK